LHEKFIFNYVSAWGRKLTIENSTYHYIKMNAKKFIILQVLNCFVAWITPKPGQSN